MVIVPDGYVDNGKQPGIYVYHFPSSLLQMRVRYSFMLGALLFLLLGRQIITAWKVPQWHSIHPQRRVE